MLGDEQFNLPVQEANLSKICIYSFYIQHLESLLVTIFNQSCSEPVPASLNFQFLKDSQTKSSIMLFLEANYHVAIYFYFFEKKEGKSAAHSLRYRKLTGQIQP